MQPASNVASCFNSEARPSGKREEAIAEREVKDGLFFV